MSPELPHGFAIASYQALLRDLLGGAPTLALCEGGQILLAEDAGADAAGLERISAALRRGSVDGVVAHRVAVPGRELALFVAVACASQPAGAARVESAAALLPRLGALAAESWRQCEELDEMTDELTERYEELSLIYRMERYGTSDVGRDATSLESVRGLLEDAATHLAVPALVALAPQEDLDLQVSGRDAPPVPGALGLLRACADGLHQAAREGEGAVVLNRADDPRRTGALAAADAKLIAATIGVGEVERGVVAALRGPAEKDFRSGDRKLLTVLADQIAAYLYGSRDDLTGLLNRRGFERRVGASLTVGASAAIVLYLDLHQFRVLNDTCGRMAGDELLRQVAEVLGQVTRRTDLVARVGGDEFALLIDECAADNAGAVADKLLDRISQHEFVWSGKAQRLRASAGVVPLENFSGPRDPQRLLALAEAACELALELGPGHHHVYAERDERVLEKRGQVQWVPRIRDALDGGRFELFAQVIQPIAAAAGRLPHQELLLRLRDEDGSLISPAGFIPAAERFQLMSQVDRWVVSHALDTLCDPRWTWAAREAVWSINLSGQSLSDVGFHSFLLEALERHEFPLHNLCFEVTETAAVKNHRAASALMRRLGKRGVSFALDDFGTGMASFAYLRSLPVNELKIDGSFVRGLADDGLSRATVDAVSRVGKALGLVTVAEYVEDDSVLSVLRELGIDYAQGFGLGRPVPLAETLDRMAGRRRCALESQVVALRIPGTASV